MGSGVVGRNVPRLNDLAPPSFKLSSLAKHFSAGRCKDLNLLPTTLADHKWIQTLPAKDPEKSDDLVPPTSTRSKFAKQFLAQGHKKLNLLPTTLAYHKWGVTGRGVRRPDDQVPPSST